ncbi:myo-inositol-1(or 4)-monophosphatase [Rhizobium sp. BK077]|uniref:inositol monophosphatase family protein n=1 Tax=unclassified Rhizobium TaxID=2613769 RepID=UPI001607D109|nr:MULTISPECIES: inositol monophosphatase family protein [unclassified Rhizobium]MBB3302201.1 myo-inositol-1(or 4)-monophosphatase [Rhizobium sp. BK112]MBB3371323.1 myo-inositol-1(or 4)-monophosphatase [Rhizobium sp. BK077]MBB4182189.1 myo-inositol-1(or 4)-monophosphatase [Rhizobium sp. BK109]MBB4255618.1 myo-inositol-1(or 4)-monophosphatase [Rhizobium sp. BK008]
MITPEIRLRGANELMIEAEALALEFFNERDRFVLEEKKANEFVSEADREVEQLIRGRLESLFPGDPVMGEEMGGDGAEAFWSIDPIDGTANFLRGTPLWGVSLGFVENGKSTVGVISYPSLGLRLSAGTGLGVSKNGERFDRKVHFPSVRVAAVGESPRWSAEGIAEVELALRKAGWGVAEYRCATIGLGFAALGYTDGYVEKNTSIWDIAAGSVICAEAGLEVFSEGTYEVASQNIIAATREVHEVVGRLF